MSSPMPLAAGGDTSYHTISIGSDESRSNLIAGSGGPPLPSDKKSDPPPDSTVTTQKSFPQQVITGVKRGWSTVDPSVTHAYSAWKPTFLKRRVLVAIAAALIVMILVLEVLRRESNAVDGYLPGSQYMHYTWVYIPVFCQSILHVYRSSSIRCLAN